MTTTLHIISVSVFFKRLKSHRSLFLKVQLIINENLFRQWLGTEQTLNFKALPESVVIQVNGAYKFLLDWLLITSSYWEMYIDAEKNGTVWAHEGYLHPHSWMCAIPTRQVGSGRGRDWLYFIESRTPRGIWVYSVDTGIHSHENFVFLLPEFNQSDRLKISHMT